MGNLKKHKSIVHEGLKIHQCDICSKVFAQSFDLKRHIITVHEGAKNYKCDRCDQKFSQAGNLKQHLNSVHDPSNVPLSVASELNNANHETSPPSELNIKATEEVDIGEIISPKNNPEIQMMKNDITDNNKNHKCDFCDKSYHQKYHLKNHIQLMHRLENNSETEIMINNEESSTGSIHKCQFCRKDFDTHPLLKIHIENVHKRGPKRTKTQKCAICDSIFSNMEDLRDHYIENHNDTELWKQSSLSKSNVDQDQKSIQYQKSILDYHQNQSWNILEAARPSNAR